MTRNFADIVEYKVISHRGKYYCLFYIVFMKRKVNNAQNIFDLNYLKYV